MAKSSAPNTSTSSLDSRVLDQSGSVDEKRSDADNRQLKYLTITFRNLSITANEAGTDYGDTFLSEIDPRRLFSCFSRRNQTKKVLMHAKSLQHRTSR